VTQTTVSTPDPGAPATSEEVAVTAIKQTVTIQPGGRIEVVSGELPEGRQAEVIILVAEARTRRRLNDDIGTGQGLLPDTRAANQSSHEAAGLQPEEQPHEYPTAGFVKQTEYAWDEDFFAAENAVIKYLKDSHADHNRSRLALVWGNLESRHSSLVHLVERRPHAGRRAPRLHGQAISQTARADYELTRCNRLEGD
jgi:hypothetical protein